MPQTQNDILTTALEYAELGLPVFPCVYAPDDEERNKKPHTPHGFKDATTEPSIIKQWWARWPEAHVAIATGKPSEIVILDLDVDEKKGKNGPAEIPDWETRSPVIVRSPRGGLHLWFKYEPEKPIRNSSDKIAKGVDTRGDGGYVIVPHPRNGSGYVFEKGCAQDLKDLQPFPEDLHGRLPANDPVRTSNGNPEAPIELVALAVSLIPNDDLGWDDWNKIGMAIWRATAGKGFAIFDTWSQKSKKYDGRKTLSRWNGYYKSPPTQIGAGTLFHHAYEAAGPGWDDKFHAELIKNLFTPNEETIELRESYVTGIKPKADEPKADEPKTESKPEPETKAESKAQPEPKSKTKKNYYLLSSAEFVAGFVPPEYLIDGWLQRRYVYSMTAPTNSGKTAIALRIAAHVALGLPVAGRDVEKGKVLYFAGENPDDVRTRWIKLCDELKKEPNEMDVVFLAGTPNIADDLIRRLIENEAFDYGEFSLLIIDTAAAYFSGDNENDNTQLGKFARDLRKYVELKGGPTILITCHPKKDFDPNNLLPRGGGAFLNEMDGNIVVLRDGDVLTIDTHGKFRGPEFDPFSFKLLPGYNPKIKDAKGRLISSVSCEPITEEARSEIEDEGRGKLDQLILAMKTNPKASLADLAVALNHANKGVVFRMMQKLEKQKWVTKKGTHYELTKKGDEVVAEIESGAGRIKPQSPKVIKNLFIHYETEKGVLAFVPGEDVEFWMPKGNITIKPEPNENGTYEVTMESWVWTNRKAAKKPEPMPEGPNNDAPVQKPKHKSFTVGAFAYVTGTITQEDNEGFEFAFGDRKVRLPKKLKRIPDGEGEVIVTIPVALARELGLCKSEP